MKKQLNICGRRRVHWGPNQEMGIKGNGSEKTEMERTRWWRSWGTGRERRPGMRREEDRSTAETTVRMEPRACWPSHPPLSSLRPSFTSHSLLQSKPSFLPSFDLILFFAFFTCWFLSLFLSSSVFSFESGLLHRNKTRTTSLLLRRVRIMARGDFHQRATGPRRMQFSIGCPFVGFVWNHNSLPNLQLFSFFSHYYVIKTSLFLHQWVGNIILIPKNSVPKKKYLRIFLIVLWI